MDVKIDYKWASGKYKLSFREWEILMLLIDGKNKREVSNKFGISMSTIYSYERSIKIKINAKNLCEATKKLCSSFYIHYFNSLYKDMNAVFINNASTR